MSKSLRKTGREHNKGFTLVELVVVLVIIALLAAILAPALLGYIDQAQKERELTNAKALLNAVQSKLSSLYDQGMMPNYDFHDIADQSVASGFSWKKDWSADVIYNAGLENKPFVCGFCCGDLCSSHTDNCLNKGLAELKKGYKVYIFFYMETMSSVPVFFYNGEWSYEVPTLPLVSAEPDPPQKYSSWYVPYGCEGDKGSTDARNAWKYAEEAAKKNK